MRILIVEDEKELLNSIKRGLELDGYSVDTACTGEEALFNIDVESYDLVILDLNLPDMFGFDIIKHTLKDGKNLKFIILTAHSELSLKVEGLDLGASDYMVKPFYFEELEARIRMLLRRKITVNNIMLSFGRLNFDTLKRELTIDGEIINLTKKETAIIEYFLINQESVISAEDLISHAWDNTADGFSNSIRVHLTTLRKKIKNKLGYNPIVNKIGEGYYLKEE